MDPNQRLYLNLAQCLSWSLLRRQESKEGGRDQDSVQSRTTPEPGKNANTIDDIFVIGVKAITREATNVNGYQQKRVNGTNNDIPDRLSPVAGVNICSLT